jgi:hypothetical protein
MKDTQERKQDLRRAAIIALLIHIGLAVLFFFLIVGFKTIPPPDEQWVEMGMTDVSGFSQSGGSASSSSSAAEEQVVEESVTEPVTQPQTADPVVTQQSSDVSTTTTPDPDPDPEPTVSSALENALNKIDGDDDDDDDDNGDDDDDDDDDDGEGPRSGPGFDIEGFGGRGIVGKPQLGNDHSKKGDVCLKLVANRDGVITEATYRPDCSTTTSSDLIDRAIAAVMGVQLIAADQTANSRDIGKITIKFKLQ